MTYASWSEQRGAHTVGIPYWCEQVLGTNCVGRSWWGAHMGRDPIYMSMWCWCLILMLRLSCNNHPSWYSMAVPSLPSGRWTSQWLGPMISCSRTSHNQEPQIHSRWGRQRRFGDYSFWWSQRSLTSSSCLQLASHVQPLEHFPCLLAASKRRLLYTLAMGWKRVSRSGIKSGLSGRTQAVHRSFLQSIGTLGLLWAKKSKKVWASLEFLEGVTSRQTHQERSGVEIRTMCHGLLSKSSAISDNPQSLLSIIIQS